MKVLCCKDSRGKKNKQETQKIIDDLVNFNNNHYSKIIGKKLAFNCTNLSTVLDEEAIKIMTGYHNHIQNNIEQFMNRYINIMLNKNDYISFFRSQRDALLKHLLNNKQLTKTKRKNIIKNCKDAISIYCEGLREAKKDIISGTNSCNNPIYRKVINKCKTYLPKNIGKNGVLYDVVCDPLKYLPFIIRMSIEIEEKEVKSFCCFPLRKSYIPGYINIGTTTLILILMKNNTEYGGDKKGYYLTNRNTRLQSFFLWNLFFRTERKMFKLKGYMFDDTISTDGIGCSIQFIRKELYGRYIKSMRKPRNYEDYIYIDDLSDSEKEIYKKYNIVGIDPGKNDLIYCTDGKYKIKNGKHINHTFRYSNLQRSKELKTKEFNKQRAKCGNNKKSEHLDKSFITFLESHISKYSSKTNNIDIFTKYVKYKEALSIKIRKHYREKLYRQLKWYSYINKRKSEDKMINNFSDTFGNPQNTLVCIGDWSGNNSIKGKAPTKGKSMRDLFRRNGYNVLLVNEYNTSIRSFIDGDKLEKFRLKGNYKCHGLLRSETVPEGKLNNFVVNRDLNGSMNILKKAKLLLKNKELPDYLIRKKRASSSDDS
jgi:transposase